MLLVRSVVLQMASCRNVCLHPFELPEQESCLWLRRSIGLHGAKRIRAELPIGSCASST